MKLRIIVQKVMQNKPRQDGQNQIIQMTVKLGKERTKVI